MNKALSDQQSEFSARAWLRRHAAILALGALVLFIMPAYVAAMELQLFDIEYLAALCGFPGWGSGAQ